MKRNRADEAAKKFKFTDVKLRKLPAPTTGQFSLFYDSEVSGLCLRLMSSGSRSFALRYRSKGQERYISIGRFSMKQGDALWSVAAARKRASEMKENVRLGRDPLDERRAELAEADAPTVKKLIEHYLEKELPKRRPSTQRDYRNCIAHDFGPLHKKRLMELSSDDVDGWFRRISKRAPLRANMAHSILRSLLNLAIEWNKKKGEDKGKWMIDANPALEVKRNPEEKRERYLNQDELARLMKALVAEEDQEGANIIHLLLYTGSRRGETQAMRWDQLDQDMTYWTKPASATKDKKRHKIYLNPPARQLLTGLRREAEQTAKENDRQISPWVFPAAKAECGHRVEIQKTWVRLCRAAKIEDCRIHDLRHSFASLLVSSGRSLELIGKMLGHSNPTITNRYSHISDAPLREAADYVGSLLTGQPAEVIQLRSTK